jgi:hypothetical protein
MQNKAVERFADWLTTLTVQKEVAYNVAGGSSRAKIVLCGHRYVCSSTLILFFGLYFTLTKYGWFAGSRLHQRIHPHTA